MYWPGVYHGRLVKIAVSFLCRDVHYTGCKLYVSYTFNSRVILTQTQRNVAAPFREELVG